MKSLLEGQFILTKWRSAGAKTVHVAAWIAQGFVSVKVASAMFSTQLAAILSDRANREYE